VKPTGGSLGSVGFNRSTVNEDRSMEETATTESATRRVWVWGVPFAPYTLVEAVAAVLELIREGRPSFFITAPTHYAMLTEDCPDLREINDRAAFILADGKPLVWASRMLGTPLPERVAGSDLIFHLCEEAAREGFRVFLLGGAQGVADEAARRLIERYPGLQIVGTECPPFRQPTPEEEEALLDRIRRAAPDLLFVAFGQPKGERWIIRHYQALGVPVSVQVGASLDFAAGRVRRAPRWMQNSGLEWVFRLSLEPRRLAGRYARNAWFILRRIGPWSVVRGPLHADADLGGPRMSEGPATDHGPRTTDNVRSDN
jgi:N-acetylglucosaminyldiphosphoundecaprenol N-acetyl-beta-D-mannosaminyltransferase